MCEFWKTFNTLKSEITWLYIREKKENKVLRSKPITAILWNCGMEFESFLKEVKNCKIAKHNESQSVKYPREGAINPLPIIYPEECWGENKQKWEFLLIFLLIKNKYIQKNL